MSTNIKEGEYEAKPDAVPSSIALACTVVVWEVSYPEGSLYDFPSAFQFLP